MQRRISIITLLLLSFAINSSDTIVAQNSDGQNVVFIGASNTVEEITSVPRNGSYITSLRTLNPTWQAVNLIDNAIPGWGVRNYHGEVSLLNETVFEQDPDYVVVVLGGNDFLRSMTIENFEIKYKWLLDALIFLDTQRTIKQVFLANIYWGTLELDEARTSIFEIFQDIISNYSHEYKFPLLDFFNVTESHPEYYVDSIHLNDQGHEVIANEVDRVVGPYLLGNLTRTAEYSNITEIYTNSYVDNSPGFVLSSIVLVLPVIIVTIKLKNRKY